MLYILAVNDKEQAKVVIKNESCNNLTSKKDIFRQNVVKGFYLLLFVAFFTDTTSTVKTSVLYGFILPICLAP